ncbi:extracellular solute-binding protein [Granulosicoccus sp. 3-233]|uniref:extracellular solute-binding protein n=1 Tax=Granulosicoccus sp. 3-233 TaxID=3417969 RepID=UPI003D353AA0
MNPDRRKFTQLLSAGVLASKYSILHAENTHDWYQSIAQRARQLSHQGPLHLLIPQGSGASVQAGTDAFTNLTGIDCIIREAPVDEINVELVLQAHSGDSTVDVALPATFGLPALVEARAIMALDELAEKYEPSGFSDGYLYRKGDYYRDRLYGYQTDGDAYLLFYNKRMLEDPAEQTAFERLHGRPLGIARTWQELDEMMAFFHRPEQQQYGGCLFRNAAYLVWEWWARFHAKGFYPVQDDMTPNVNNTAGVEALEELIAASQWQSPDARTNGLFENWTDFAQDNAFCNIGWGGTQKHMMTLAGMRDNLVHSPLPGISGAEGTATGMGYFNWGWNFTVSAQSVRSELAYLLTLFCTSPHVSTLAVRQPSGFFDPFRQSHYTDDVIQSVYGVSFLDAHRQSLANCIPDFYISGQSSYLDALRQQILATFNGEVDARRALDICAQRWNHVTRRLGARKQSAQWLALKSNYPESLQALLRDS